ncbi:MAG TPA: ROK family protein [Clostridiaceae bacterium]|nr:ROK family protein [Clostridiaceae bacterium]
MNPTVLSEKANNLRNITELVIQKGSLSRPDLVRLTNLSPATVTNLTKELLNKNVIVEKGKQDSGLGRKAKLLEFNPRIGYFINVNIESSLPAQVYLTDLSGEVIEMQKKHINFEIDATNSEEIFVGNVIGVIKNFIDSLDNLYRKKIIAIGVSVPAVVNFDESIYSPLFKWYNIPLKASIENALKIPTYLENIARIKAIYEMNFIDKSIDKNVIYLALGTGIGMVNFYDSKLIRGKHSIAGEIGHMSLNYMGEKCYCGNKGCFELYCGERNVLKKAKELVESNQSPILSEIIHNNIEELDIKSLFLAQQMGDMKVHKLLEEVGRYLGFALANLVNCFDPDRIIVSGDLITEGNFVYDCAMEEMKRRVFDILSRNIDINKAKLKNSDIARAIANFILGKTLNDIVVSR